MDVTGSYTGLPLSRRLEAAEAQAGARFVEARGRVAPDSGACWMEAAGAYAMFDGANSPVTQTFRLGLFQMPAPEDMDRIEKFFHDRGAPVMHEVSPLADKAMLPLLSDRGYRPLELSDVMFLPLASRPAVECIFADGIDVCRAGAGEHELWAKTAVEGWREFTEITGFMTDLMRVVAARTDGHDFLVKLDGRPIAAGSLHINNGVALFSGASTIPEWRRRGAQRALVQYRLDYAARVGCDLAMICTEPGSASQRNAQHYGFRVAYTRIKWALQR